MAVSALPISVSESNPSSGKILIRCDGGMHLMPVNGVVFRYTLQYSSGGDRGVFGLLYGGEQHDKFIAALPAYGVRAAHATNQPLTDGFQKLVAHRVPQSVVYRFESSKSRNMTATFFECRVAVLMACFTRSANSMRLGNPVRKSCCAECAICSVMALAALTSGTQ